MGWVTYGMTLATWLEIGVEIDMVVFHLVYFFLIAHNFMYGYDECE